MIEIINVLSKFIAYKLLEFLLLKLFAWYTSEWRSSEAAFLDLSHYFIHLMADSSRAVCGHSCRESRATGHY